MKFPDAVEEQLEADIFTHRGEPAPENPPRLTADESLDAKYLEFLRKKLLPGANLRGFRLVMDCANGAAYKLGPELFRSLGADVVAMNVSPDGRNINASCGSLHLEGLEKRDRKSTRLNSSHGYISYAVFCLKKKNELQRSYEQRILLDAELVEDLVRGLLHDLRARVVVLVDAMTEDHEAERVVGVLVALDAF